MSKHIISSLRRIGTVSMITYFVLPLLPGVTFSGNILSAIGFSTMLFAASVGDLVLVALFLRYLNLISNQNFAFDFKMETKSTFAPFFLSALMLSELRSIAHKFGVLTFEGWLPVVASALILALATWSVCLKFDAVLFDLNIDRQGSRPRGGKKVRVPVAARTK